MVLIHLLLPDRTGIRLGGVVKSESNLKPVMSIRNYLYSKMQWCSFCIFCFHGNCKLLSLRRDFFPSGISGISGLEGTVFKSRKLEHLAFLALYSHLKTDTLALFVLPTFDVQYKATMEMSNERWVNFPKVAQATCWITRLA